MWLWLNNDAQKTVGIVLRHTYELVWICLDHLRFGMDWRYGSPVGLNP
jgi:hypothetical protein